MSNIQSNLSLKEYLRPFEVTAVFGIDNSTLYRWIKEDDEFPELIKPSPKITLINKRAFEEYLRKRTSRVKSEN